MTNEERQAWLAERKTGIGASDAAAIVGVSPWQQPLDVWLSKQPDQPESKQSFRMMLGTLLEPALAELYSKETGRALVKCQLARHAERPWQLATLDYRADGRNVQLKTTDSFNADQWGEPGSDEIPENYLVQVQHEMLVSGLPVTDVAVLIGLREFRIYTVEFDIVTADAITDMEHDFWHNHVLKGIPPEVNWEDPRTPELIKRLNVPKAGSVDLDWDDCEQVKLYELLGEQMAELKTKRELTQAHLIARMGEAVEGVLPDGRAITRKMVERKAYSVEACSYADCRIKKPAKKGKVTA